MLKDKTTTELNRKQRLAKKLAGSGFKFRKKENTVMSEIDLKRRLRQFRIGISACVGIAVAVCGVSYYLNASGKFVSNFTDSMPKGYYSIVERNPASVTNEEIVTFCPDHTVYLSESFARRYLQPAESGENCWVTPLLKVVGAKTGDHVHADENGIVVNGVVLAHSGSQPRDGFGQDMKIWRYDGIVPEGKVVLVNPMDLSFDSRYFGMVDTKQIREKVVPFWTWG